MCAATLADKLQLKSGPLAITLQTCCVLGCVDSEPDTGCYHVRQSDSLGELKKLLDPQGTLSRIFWNIYKDAIPSFEVQWVVYEYCCQIWEEFRSMWKDTQNKALSILLDGILLAPVITSITDYARWNKEGLDYGKEHKMERFNFGQCRPAVWMTLGKRLKSLVWALATPTATSPRQQQGELAPHRCDSYYVPTSYSPMLPHFHTILHEDAGWGFVGLGQDTNAKEIHDEHTLNVVGSGAQHQTLFKDMMRHLNILFGARTSMPSPSMWWTLAPEMDTCSCISTTT